MNKSKIQKIKNIINNKYVLSGLLLTSISVVTIPVFVSSTLNPFHQNANEPSMDQNNTSLINPKFIFEDNTIKGIRNTNLSYSEIKVPNDIDGISVFHISDNAFANQNLKKVELPDTLQTIGANAFYNNDISEISIPSNVQLIAPSAFNKSGLLKQNIDFSKSNITDGQISLSLESKENYIKTFAEQLDFDEYSQTILGYKSSLLDDEKSYDLVIPDEINNKRVLKIAPNAFKDAGLLSLVLPNYLEEIGDNAFDTNSIQSIVLTSRIKKIGHNAFVNNQLSDIEIPNSVNWIGDNAFSKNKFNFKSTIVIPTKLDGMENRKRIGLPESVFKVDSNGVLKGYTEGITDDLKLEILNIPDHVYGTKIVKIDQKAFEFISIKSIIVPSAVVSIDSRAFFNTAVSSLSFKSNPTLRTIGNEAFKQNNLKTLNLPSTLTSIGDSAFTSNKLTSISLPDSISYLGEWAFDQNKLTSAKLPKNISSISNGLFANNAITSIQIPRYVTKIGDNAFYRNEISGSLNFPSSLKSIGKSSFMDNKITSINLENVNSLGEHAFDTNLLTNVRISNSISTIPDYLFANNRISRFNFFNGLTSIGKNAFFKNSLTSVSLPSSMKTIEAGAFNDNQIYSLSINNGLTKIENSAFAYNYLSSLSVPDSVTTIETGAFVYNSFTTSSNIRLPAVFDSKEMREMIGLPTKTNNI